MTHHLKMIGVVITYFKRDFFYVIIIKNVSLNRNNGYTSAECQRCDMFFSCQQVIGLSVMWSLRRLLSVSNTDKFK